MSYKRKPKEPGLFESVWTLLLFFIALHGIAAIAAAIIAIFTE